MKKNSDHGIPMLPSIEEKSSSYVKIPLIIFIILSIIFFITYSFGVFSIGMTYQKGKVDIKPSVIPTSYIEPTVTEIPTTFPTLTEIPESTVSSEPTETVKPAKTKSKL